MKNIIKGLILFSLVLIYFCIPIYASDTIKVENIYTISDSPNSVYMLMNNGELWVYGGNSSGQLGTGDTRNVDKPMKIMTDVKDVSVINAYGSIWAYILKEDGSLWGTGSNLNGQLLLETKEFKFTPVKIMDGCTQIAGEHILKQDGSAYAIWSIEDTSVDYNKYNWKDSISYELFKASEDVQTLIPKEEYPIADAIYVKKDGTIEYQGKNIDCDLINKPVKYVAMSGFGSGLSAYILLDDSCIITDYGTEMWWMKRSIISTIDNVADVKIGMMIFGDEGRYTSTQTIVVVLTNNNELLIIEDNGNEHTVANDVIEIYKNNYYLTKDNTLFKWGLKPGLQEIDKYEFNTFEYAENVEIFSASQQIYIDMDGKGYQIDYNGSDPYITQIFDFDYYNQQLSSDSKFDTLVEEALYTKLLRFLLTN